MFVLKQVYISHAPFSLSNNHAPNGERDHSIHLTNSSLLFIKAPSCATQNMSTMFRKPKRNFRQRIVKNDSDEEGTEDMETEDVGYKPDTKADLPKKSKEKKKKDSSKSILSFDHEEGNF